MTQWWRVIVPDEGTRFVLEVDGRVAGGVQDFGQDFQSWAAIRRRWGWRVEPAASVTPS